MAHVAASSEDAETGETAGDTESPRPAVSPADWSKVQKQFDALPEEEKAVILGLLAFHPESAASPIEEIRKLKAKADDWDAYVKRQRSTLLRDTQHSPVKAIYAGKAMLVRVRVDPRNRDNISKPTIFGVFASKAASGVLESDGDYEVAVICARGSGRSTRANKASQALTNPIKLLEKRCLVKKSPTGRGVCFGPGCEEVFDDDLLLVWPKPKKRAEYVEPRPE